MGKIATSTTLLVSAVFLLVTFVFGCARRTADSSHASSCRSSRHQQITETQFGPTVAGRFYPADAATLRTNVSSFIEHGATHLPPLHGQLLGVVAPHAGYRFSGPVAGVTYAAVARHPPRTVVVLGPSHHARRPYACVLDVDRYATPLGAMSIDTADVTSLAAHSRGVIRVDQGLFRAEHSVDVQIPFLQVAAPKARLVPIVVPWMSRKKLKALGDVLFTHFGHQPGVLIVASSDLSHYFPIALAREIDQQILSEILQRRAEALLAAHNRRRGPCGVAPIVVLLEYLAHFSNTQVTVLDSSTSGDTVPSTASKVVGYGAVAMTAGPQ